ncbi:MAG: NUDIX hydrolase [Pyrinomonadaceae bacterium]
MGEITGKAALPKIKTVDQISAGGFAFRKQGSAVEAVLIKTSEEGRWQLPKGIIDPGETPEQAALREVREEAGIECEILEKIATIEYWFYASYDGERKRYHKHVHFYLMKYISGDVVDHDHEVIEARWVAPALAAPMLSFKDEKGIAEKAIAMIERRSAA